MFGAILESGFNNNFPFTPSHPEETAKTGGGSFLRLPPPPTVEEHPRQKSQPKDVERPNQGSPAFAPPKRRHSLSQAHTWNLLSLLPNPTLVPSEGCCRAATRDATDGHREARERWRRKEERRKKGKIKGAFGREGNRGRSRGKRERESGWAGRREKRESHDFPLT